jgi:uridine kinase
MSIERPFIVLVAGGTASGKSSIVSRFVEKTGAAHIGHDRYYFDAEKPRSHDFDHPSSLQTELLVSHVDDLRSGHTVSLPIYDFATHSRCSETEQMAPSPLIVVEGILVMNEPRLVELADICVFVDAPESIRLSRRIARDVRERGRTEESVRAQYAATVQPSHDRFVEPSKAHAGLILDGTAPLDESVGHLMRLIPESVLVCLR